MAVKFLYYFVVVFIGLTLFLITKEPYSIDFYKETKKIPSIVMKDVKNFDLTTNGISSIVTADEVKRYREYDEFLKINMLNKSQDEFIHEVSADKGKLKDKKFTLSQNVKYHRNDGVSLKSEEVIYIVDTKTLYSEVDFVLSNNRAKTYGNSFSYDIQNGTIDAQNIKAKIKQKAEEK